VLLSLLLGYTCVRSAWSSGSLQTQGEHWYDWPVSWCFCCQPLRVQVQPGFRWSDTPIACLSMHIQTQWVLSTPMWVHINTINHWCIEEAGHPTHVLSRANQPHLHFILFFPERQPILLGSVLTDCLAFHKNLCKHFILYWWLSL